MKSFPAFAVLVLTLLAAPVAAQPSMVSLRDTAAGSGYHYAWLQAEQAASLTKPGLVILVRPGNRAYEVNERSEFAAESPRLAGNDILVPLSLAQRLRVLAASRGHVPQTEPFAIQQRPLVGTLSVSVAPAAGQEAIVVSGTGPASAPVTLVLEATISREIPTILVSRHDLHIDRSGNFSATISIAPDFMRDTILTVRAMSLPTIASAEAHMLVGTPNPHITVPAEQLPPGDSF